MLTPNGLVAVPVPIISNNLVTFTGVATGSAFTAASGAENDIQRDPIPGEQQHIEPELERLALHQ